jgi:hypothetical protein
MSGGDGLSPEPQKCLFAGHDAGAENWAVIASLIETCKMNAVDPHEWLSYAAGSARVFLHFRARSQQRARLNASLRKLLD